MPFISGSSLLPSPLICHLYLLRASKKPQILNLRMNRGPKDNVTLATKNRGFLALGFLFVHIGEDLFIAPL